MAVIIASTHFAYSRRDGQAELAWICTQDCRKGVTDAASDARYSAVLPSKTRSIDKCAAVAASSSANCWWRHAAAAPATLGLSAQQCCCQLATLSRPSRAGIYEHHSSISVWSSITADFIDVINVFLRFLFRSRFLRFFPRFLFFKNVKCKV